MYVCLCVCECVFASALTCGWESECFGSSLECQQRVMSARSSRGEEPLSPPAGSAGFQKQHLLTETFSLCRRVSWAWLHCLEILLCVSSRTCTSSEESAAFITSHMFSGGLIYRWLPPVTTWTATNKLQAAWIGVNLVLYDNKLNIFGFLTVGRTKQEIWRCLLRL